MPTEFFCSRCRTVAVRSEKSYAVGDTPQAEDLVVVDERLTRPEHGGRLVCAECGEDSGWMARGDGLAEPEPVFAMTT